jgi:hypothetical protein
MMTDPKTNQPQAYPWSEPLRNVPGGRLADGEPNMALLGEPMEKLGSKAKRFRAIVIKDEDFRPIDV